MLGFVPSYRQICTIENTITSQKMSQYDSSLKPSRFALFCTICTILLRPSFPSLIQKPRPPYFSRNHLAIYNPSSLLFYQPLFLPFTYPSPLTNPFITAATLSLPTHHVHYFLSIHLPFLTPLSPLPPPVPVLSSRRSLCH